jgi:predicted metal-dependent hydrolase
MIDGLREILIEGHPIKLIIQSHPRAKYLKLRCDLLGEQVFLTLPKRVNKKEAFIFIEKSRPWLRQQLQQRRQRIPFAPGATIPILGQPYNIKHTPSRRTTIHLKEHTLVVMGDESRVPLLVTQWLRFHALGHMRQKSLELAQELGVIINNVRIRELKSLWGSCSANGNLTYSWRLIMAPQPINEYICAHEVSHLVEPNHSPRFWSVVESICPHFERSRKWMRLQGKTLFLYGNSNPQI